MKNNLYSILIGINNYPGRNALNGCVGDAKRMEAYLNTLQSDQFNILTPNLLIDEDASKSNIVDSIEKIVKKLKDGDTFLFYFSGHGAREESIDRFKEDYNGVLESIVCHYQENFMENILADKEMRYLFNQCTTNAHIVGVFDSCHSGDIIKDITNTLKAKRVPLLPQRDYSGFIFSGKADLEDFEDKWFDQVFGPDANITTISSSLSHELSWEKEQNGVTAGVFTTNLLKVLEETNSVINYNDLMKKVEISIRNTTRIKQTPTLDIQGNSTYSQLTSWLQLHGERLLSGAGFIQFNATDGWIYSRGEAVGVTKGDTIIIRLPSLEEVELKIEEVKLTSAKIQLPTGVELDKQRSYAVIDAAHYPKPVIFIENLEPEIDYFTLLKQLLIDDDNVNWTNQQEDADFQISIFNQSVYFTFPNDPYRPLQAQIDLTEFDSQTNLEDELKKFIAEGADITSKWLFYKNLEKHDGFDAIPIRVEIFLKEENQWKDVTNGLHTFIPARQDGSLTSSTFDIKITNTSRVQLYVTPITLFLANLQIASDSFFDDRTEIIESGNSVYFREGEIWMDDYQEIYNWREEIAYFKFFVSTSSVLTTTLPDITQIGFDSPLIHSSDGVERIKGGGRGKKKEHRGIYSTELRLLNTSYNQITGLLREKIHWYKESELISPFIERLYFRPKPGSLCNKIENRAHANDTEETKGIFTQWLGNTIEHGRRKRRFRQLKKKYPNKKVIIAEGDSWFMYPIRVKDTIDYLMEDRPVNSLAWAGDTLENYKNSGTLLEEVQKEAENGKPIHVLISGGGNDIIGPNIKNLLKNNIQCTTHPKEYLNAKYKTQMGKLRDFYLFFFEELSQEDMVEKILVHGYDYIRTNHASIVNDNGWVNQHLIDAGITTSSERKKLIKYLIDEFNKGLKSLAARYPKVHMVDVRDTIASDEWYDEIHPNDQGFRKIADAFLKLL